MTTIYGVRGPIVSRQPGPTHLVSVMLQLTPQEQAAVEDPTFAPHGDLATALTTIDFCPRKVRCEGNEMIIDYAYNGNTSPTDIAEQCRQAVEAKLQQAAN